MTAAEIGARLREARLQRGISLRSVAQALGVSACLISQVETGKTQPSVSTLYAMVNHLGVSMDELLGDAHLGRPRRDTAVGHSGAVYPPSSAPGEARPRDGERRALGTARRRRRRAGGPSARDLRARRVQLGRGQMMRHAGIEYAYLLEGQLTLQLDFDTYVLGPGDSLQFDSIRPHMFTNHGQAQARGIWFVFGRRQQNQAMPSATGADPLRSAGLTSAVDVLRAMDDLRH